MVSSGCVFGRGDGVVVRCSFPTKESAWSERRFRRTEGVAIPWGQWVRIFTSYTLFLLFTLLAGCATITLRPTSKTTLEFLQDGSTAKGTILHQFGDPFMVLMDQRLLIYRVAKTQSRYSVLEQVPESALVFVEPGAWLPGGIEGLFQLVLLFDTYDVLQQHALVRINNPYLTSATALIFLVDGATTKAAAFLRLGAPASALMGETVLTYRLAKFAEEYHVVEKLVYGPVGPDVWLLGREPRSFHLVLVFDAHDILQQQVLVPINSTLGDQTGLAFLLDGVTTKEAVLLHLGTPSGVLDGETILTYRLGKTSQGYCVLEKQPTESVPVGPAAWLIGGLEGEFDLVMTFDPHHVLQHHSLIQIH